MEHSDLSTARLTIRLGAISDNYREFTRRCPTAGVAAAVKADAYGLGLAPVAQALIDGGCDTFFVARVEEGIALRKLHRNVRIFVLDGALDGAPPALIAHRLIPVLNSLTEIECWAAASRAERVRLDCAIHFDTGMNRLGLSAGDSATLAANAERLLRDIQVVLWMSHLACGDDCASPINRQQLATFRESLAILPAAPASLSASAGALLGSEYHFDLVRPGIGLYGGNPCINRPNPFAVVAVLTGRILQLRLVDTGETVGYGASFRAARPSTLATIGLGYADGLMRAIGNRGVCAMAGVRVPVVGRVSMDLITLDVSNVRPDALGIDAEVEFFGDTISLDEFAAHAGTANYEALTSLGHRVPREYEPAA